MIHAPDDRLLRVEDLACKMECSVRQVWRLDAANRLPAPIRLGRMVRWREREFLAWMNAGSPDRDEWTARWEAMLASEQHLAREIAHGQRIADQPLATAHSLNASQGNWGHLR